jgi:CRP/FNR family transcriptional regulator, cyclic AMP receptor protein
MMPPDERSFLSEIELFGTLSGEDFRELAGRLPNISLGDNQIFYTPEHRGESFFLLLSGRMRIYRMRQAREITLSVIHPGQFFGEASLAGLPKGAYAQSLEPARIALMHRRTLRRLAADRPEVGAVLVELLAERLSLYEDKLEEISLLDTPVRLARLLVRMIETEGVAEDGEYVIPDHYTHQLLASMIGCERPALTRALGKLRTAGMIQLTDRHIHVSDIPALKRYGESP